MNCEYMCIMSCFIVSCISDMFSEQVQYIWHMVSIDLRINMTCRIFRIFDLSLMELWIHIYYLYLFYNKFYLFSDELRILCDMSIYQICSLNTGEYLWDVALLTVFPICSLMSCEYIWHVALFGIYLIYYLMTCRNVRYFSKYKMF